MFEETSNVPAAKYKSQSCSQPAITTHPMRTVQWDLLLYLLANTKHSYETPTAPACKHTYLVQTFDKTLVVLLAALNHTSQGVGEPLLEVPVWLEDVGHQEVHQRPQLHQTVLKWRPCQQKAALAGEIEQHLPSLRLEVLDVLSLWQKCFAT